MFSPRHVKSVTNSCKRRKRRREMFDACCRLFPGKTITSKRRLWCFGIKKRSADDRRSEVEEIQSRGSSGRKVNGRGGGGARETSVSANPICLLFLRSKVQSFHYRRPGGGTHDPPARAYNYIRRRNVREEKSIPEERRVGYRRLVYVSAVSPERDFRTIATRRI